MSWNSWSERKPVLVSPKVSWFTVWQRGSRAEVGAQPISQSVAVVRVHMRRRKSSFWPNTSPSISLVCTVTWNMTGSLTQQSSVDNTGSLHSFVASHLLLHSTNIVWPQNTLAVSGIGASLRFIENEINMKLKYHSLFTALTPAVWFLGQILVWKHGSTQARLAPVHSPSGCSEYWVRYWISHCVIWGVSVISDSFDFSAFSQVFPQSHHKNKVLLATHWPV